MAIKRLARQRVYGLDNRLQALNPANIIAQRAPTSADLAELGTTWVDVPNDAVYVLTSVTANSATWSTSPASGATTLAELTVTPGDLTVDTGNTTLAGTLDVTGDTSVVNLTVTGDADFQGDFDISSTDAFTITSTSNTDPAIYFHANGGTDEVIRLRSDQGTGTDSIELISDVGGVTLTATGSAAANAIDINAAGGGVAIDAAGAISLDAAAASNFTTSGAGIDIDIASGAGRVIVTAGEDAADAIDRKSVV